jgi:ATP/maltotriose-dependent transcriptional regulator MalT
VFLDEGLPIVPLLRELGRRGADLAAAITPRQATPTGLLSVREHEVLDLLNRGLSNREMAVRLVVAPDTIKSHLRHIGLKLGAGSRTQVLARARAAGLLD